MAGMLSRLFSWDEPRVMPAESEHAAAMSEIHAASFARGWDSADMARLLLEANVRGDVLLAGDEDVLAGFVLSRLAADEAEILSICLAPSARGRGWSGRLLAQHLVELGARSVGRVFLEVEDGNHPAIALYGRHGFVRVGERPDYYTKADGRQVRAIVMRRILP